MSTFTRSPIRPLPRTFSLLGWFLLYIAGAVLLTCLAGALLWVILESANPVHVGGLIVVVCALAGAACLLWGAWLDRRV